MNWADTENLLYKLVGKDLWLKVWIPFDPDLGDNYSGYAYIRVVGYQPGQPEWFDCNYLSEFLVEQAPGGVDWNRLLHRVVSLPDYDIEIDDGELYTTEELAEIFDLGYWIYGE